MENSKSRCDQRGIMMFKEAQLQYLCVLHQQSDYWRQRAKEFWLRDGDTNSIFFHNSVKRQRQINRISRLKNDEGDWVERGTGLDSLVTAYFNNLLSAVGGNFDQMIDLIESRVSAAQNSVLSCRITMQEVKIALFAMKSDKSPGPDGMSPGFLQHFWDIISSELLSFCENCFDSGKLPNGLNNTYIVLIPKKSKPEQMGDFRPIALCNILYKLVSKILANSIKPMLNSLISDSQTAFVSGRLITDNVMIAYEIHHYLKRKR